MPKANNGYISNGVSVSPAIPTAGEKLRVMYDGILSKNGATHLYAHVGYGPNWENLYDYPMTTSSIGFEANIPILNADTVNICFKDCADNWDNNSGKNYSFDISQ
jgi:hypothetical protein